MRARNIKPGFFTNDLLSECEPLARLLFAGLWCMADKAGRLDYRPKKMRIDVLPCDDCDIESLLAQLERNGFIQCYEVGGKKFIQVVNFVKHQNPHCKERESTIPAPDCSSANTVLAPGKHDTGPADSLIPDTLIPESSLNSDSGTRKRSHPKHHSPPAQLTRLSLDALPPDWAEWTRSEMGWNAETIQDVWVNFRDYWQSSTSKSAKKSDWGATWRNWCRQQNIRNGGKHAATINHNSQSARPSKSERFKQALVDSTIDELGTEGRSGGH